MGKRDAPWWILPLSVLLVAAFVFGVWVGGNDARNDAKQKTKVVYLTSDNSVTIKTDKVVIQANECIRVMDVPKELPLGAMKGGK
jgi:ABC-type transporter Mla subunit MlaD